MPRHFPVTQEVSGFRLLPGCSASGFSVTNATVHNCHVEPPKSLRNRSTISDIGIYRCEHFACSASAAIFHNVVVEDIRGGALGRTFLWGCVYSQVRLRGWIGGLLHRWMVDPNDQRMNREVLSDNRRLYEGIDLSLNLVEARFTFTQDLLGVPASTVQRNPDWHYILSEVNARRLVAEPTQDRMWRGIAEDLLETSLPDVVVVLGEGAKNSVRDKRVADALRKSDILT